MRMRHQQNKVTPIFTTDITRGLQQQQQQSAKFVINKSLGSSLCLTFSVFEAHRCYYFISTIYLESFV